MLQGQTKALRRSLSLVQLAPPQVDIRARHGKQQALRRTYPGYPRKMRLAWYNADDPNHWVIMESWTIWCRTPQAVRLVRRYLRRLMGMLDGLQLSDQASAALASEEALEESPDASKPQTP